MCAVAEKRERSPNFSIKEEEILLSLVEKHRDIVENKKTDAAMCNQKRRVWDEICADFELYSGQPRSLKNLRDKYENLKKKTRKELAEGGANISTTTGRLAVLMQISSTTDLGLKNEHEGVNADDEYTDNNHQKSSVSSDYSDHNKQLLNFLDVVIKSEHVETGEEELLEQVAPEGTDHENVPDKNICQDNDLSNFSSWASWKPASSEPKNNSSCNNNYSISSNKCEKLKTPSENRRRVKNPEVYKYSEKSRLLQAQRKFFENEDKRAEEKQRWERDQAEIKLKILETELEIKKEELKRKQNK